MTPEPSLNAISDASQSVNPPFVRRRWQVIFNQIVLIFLIGCVFGTYYEEIITLWKNFWSSGGELIWESRRGLVYGPLSPVYGIGAVVVYALFYKTKLRTATCFLAGSLFGGLLEIILSLVQELWFGTRSWDYSDRFLSIFNGRTTIVYMVFWGLLIAFAARWLFPRLERLYDRFASRSLNIACLIIASFLLFDITVSSAAATRQAFRRAGDPADNFLEILLDRHFPDERLQKIYSNARYIREN